MPCRTFVMRSLPKAKLVYFLLVLVQGGGARVGDMWTYTWNAQFVEKLKKKTSIAFLTLFATFCITLTSLSSAISIAACLSVPDSCGFSSPPHTPAFIKIATRYCINYKPNWRHVFMCASFALIAFLFHFLTSKAGNFKVTLRLF